MMDQIPCTVQYQPFLMLEFFKSVDSFCNLYRYFSSTVDNDERAEQTPEGEGSIAATKTARKLQLDDGDEEDDIVMMTSEEREDSSSLPSFSGASSHQSPHHRSPFHKSPQAMTSYLQTDSEITARKQLFPSNRSSSISNRFSFSGSKKLSSSANVGGQSPFTLLDQSQKFIGGTDSKEKKRFVVATKNTEDTESISSQEHSTLWQTQTDCIEIDSDQDDDPTSQNSVTETTVSGVTFSYMTSKDFITAHPCTQGQQSADEKPTALQRSRSVAELMLQPERERATGTPLVNLEDSTQQRNRNRRGSAIPTNSTLSKVIGQAHFFSIHFILLCHNNYLQMASSTRRGGKQRNIGIRVLCFRWSPLKLMLILYNVSWFYVASRTTQEIIKFQPSQTC